MARDDDSQERLVEAATAVLTAAGGKMNITLLNKVLFYLDLRALLETGRTATGAAYVALGAGPVVDRYETRLVQALVDRGVAVQETEGDAKPVRLVRAPQVLHFLDPRHVELSKEIATRMSGLTSTAASALSHRNPGWQIAFKQGKGAGQAPARINMNIAMQEIADSDPWLDRLLEFDEDLAFETPMDIAHKPF